MNNSTENEGPFTAFVDQSFKERSWTVSSPKHNEPANLPQLEDVVKSGDAKKVKMFLRQNHWPPHHDIRKQLWQTLCKVSTRDSGTLYSDMVSDMFGTEHHLNTSLPSFIDPSNMYQYHLTDHGVKTAKKVLCIVGKSRPDIIYAPTLYTLSCLLLHYMGEQQAFNVIEHLLTNKAKHIPQTKVSYEASVYVLKDLLRKYVKKFYNYLIQENIRPEHLLSRWMWWLFKDLPFSYLLCVFDCYLFEGPKVFYRIALAILKLFFENKTKHSTLKSDEDLTISISLFCQEMPQISVETLLKVGFKIRGFSRKEINKLVVKEEMYVTSLINVQGLQATLTKSPSCESLNDKVTVSRSFSLQEIGSSVLNSENDGTDGKPSSLTKSLSHGNVYVPFSNTQSSLLTLTHWETIWSWLPDRVRLLTPQLIFSTSEHGTSLKTFYSHVEGRETCPATLLIIKTLKQEIIGAYCSEDWSLREHNQKKLTFFGTGETFVFCLEPTRGKYEWVGVTLREKAPTTAHMFMSGDNDQIQIGGGSGIAIRLDCDLLHGETRTCDTFNNPPLTGDEYFQCATVEVFGFT